MKKKDIPLTIQNEKKNNLKRAVETLQEIKEIKNKKKQKIDMKDIKLVLLFYGIIEKTDKIDENKKINHNIILKK